MKDPAKNNKKRDPLRDYALACESRAMSLLGRKEVFMGKAKFGIFGDGKEIAQLAMAQAFEKGDFRSGYYRDQTFMLAIGELTPEAFFAQLYAHASVKHDPASGGRMMNSHFGTRLLDSKGNWKKLVDGKHAAADLSPTAGQMPRLIGLAYASKLYRENKSLHKYKDFSRQGQEVAWGTIGNASCSEGLFLETLHAGAVLQVPMVVSIWDDDYGISVPQSYHTPAPLHQVLSGYQRKKDRTGIEILTCPGWDYEGLCQTYARAAQWAREEHVPVLIHVTEMTQPQGHSTSGSHERYKSKERLAWEHAHDPIAKMETWLLQKKYATKQVLKDVQQSANEKVLRAKEKAWQSFVREVEEDRKEVVDVLETWSEEESKIRPLHQSLCKATTPWKLEAVRSLRQALWQTQGVASTQRRKAQQLLDEKMAKYDKQYHAEQQSSSDTRTTAISEVVPTYDAHSAEKDGREILQACFDLILKREPLFFAIGEDVGKIGDVNQGFAGLQRKYGALRVSDTGIREATIIGQGIGAAMRGLRPMVEIQYLDYLLYGLQPLSDDLASLRYRSCGGQKAPLIVRTRGHRLEGIWHSGSPMGMILHSLRGMHVLVPRNMTQAAGFYNTLLLSDEPALVIECLNGYRLKERMPNNLARVRIPVGRPETLREGKDLTLVTYGSMCRIALQAATLLQQKGIDLEVIDAQSLLPFDTAHHIAQSLKKTSRLLVADEDVPGGASAYILQHILEEQGGYSLLDSPPNTLAAQAHRPAYGSDGDYFSKPNAEDIIERVYHILHESNPKKYPRSFTTG